MRRRLPKLVKVCCILLVWGAEAWAQVDCPAMGITRPKTSLKHISGGFGAIRSGGGNKGSMGDFFSTRTRSPMRVREHTEFATKGGRSRFFRDMDEFAAKRQGGQNRFRDVDEFSRKGSRQGRYRDFDEFSRRANRQAESNRRSGGGKTHSGFHRTAKRERSQDSRESRSRKNRSEYTPFSTSRGPGGGEPSFREPQMGLWGGTIGKRSGKDKRKMVPMPEKGDDKGDK